MKPLSKESEARLMDAVSRVADLVSDGQMPNDAVAKVASDLGLPAGHIPLVVRAFNTGRTNAHRKSTDDVWEKAADVEIADSDIILEKVFPTSVKTAANKFHESVVAADYRTPPSKVVRGQRKQAQMELVLKAPPMQSAGYRQIKMAEGIRQQYHRIIEEKRAAASIAFDEVAKATDKLVDYFKRPGCVPFQDVRANSILKYGNAVDTLFTYISRPMFEKQASSKYPGPAVGEPYKLVERCLDLRNNFNELKLAYDEEAAKRDRPANHTKEIDGGILGKLAANTFNVDHNQPAPDFHQGYLLPGNVENILAADPNMMNQSGLATDKSKQVAMENKAPNVYPHMLPHGVMPSNMEVAPQQDNSPEEDLLSETLLNDSVVRHSLDTPDNPGDDHNVLSGAKIAGIGGAVSDFLTNPFRKLKSPDVTRSNQPPQSVEMATWELSDPALHEDIRQIQARSMLTDFMTSDDSLREKRPEQLSVAYSDLSKVAPRAMSVPVIARQYLRKYLNKGTFGENLEPMELNQLLEMEKGLKTRDSYPGNMDPFSGPNMPKATDFR